MRSAVEAEEDVEDADVEVEEDDIDVFRLPGIDTEFVKVPAHVLTYLLGRAESRAASQ